MCPLRSSLLLTAHVTAFVPLSITVIFPSWYQPWRLKVDQQTCVHGRILQKDVWRTDSCLSSNDYKIKWCLKAFLSMQRQICEIVKFPFQGHLIAFQKFIKSNKLLFTVPWCICLSHLEAIARKYFQSQSKSFRLSSHCRLKWPKSDFFAQMWPISDFLMTVWTAQIRFF